MASMLVSNGNFSNAKSPASSTIRVFSVYNEVQGRPRASLALSLATPTSLSAPSALPSLLLSALTSPNLSLPSSSNPLLNLSLLNIITILRSEPRCALRQRSMLL
ncbi:hypothetical protein CsSME_00011117 [Camellia sinensis var. sinensis]